MSLRGAVKRRPVLFELLAAAVELARNAAEFPGRFIAELHQVLRDHRQLGPAVGDPLREHFKECLEAAGLGPHRDHGAGEALGFLAARSAKNQPGKPENRQRAGSNGDPLGDLRRGQRLSGQNAPGRPGGKRKPKCRKHRQSDAEHLPPAGAAFFRTLLAPLLLVERRLDEIGSSAEQLYRWCRLLRLRQWFGALWSGGHRNRQFTIFDAARKRLEKGVTRWGNMRGGQWQNGDWRADQRLPGGR